MTFGLPWELVLVTPLVLNGIVVVVFAALTYLAYRAARSPKNG